MFLETRQLVNMHLFLQKKIKFFANFSIYNNFRKKLMGILRKLESLVKKIDFFYSTEMLRYDQDEDYKTLTGGFFSIGIVVAIVIGFANMIVSTLNQTTINTSTQVIRNPIPTNSTLQITKDSPFRFGIEIWRVNLSDTKRYFDITFSVSYQTNGVVEEEVFIPLQTCTKQYFSAYPDIVSGFDKLQAGQWLCPPMNTTMNLYGKYTSDTYSQYIITVAACKNSTDPSRPCASPTQIENFFTERQNFLYFDFYFTNPQINPDQKDYKQYYLQDMSYVLFGSGLGSQTFLYFTDYTVNTDYSIWPYENIAQDKGCIVENLAVNHHFQTHINGTYVTFNLAKSPNSIIYTREVQKVSTVFSFIGGMIGAISAVLFVIKIYNNLAFEFSISSELFKKEASDTKDNQDESDKKQEDTTKRDTSEHLSMNLWSFVRYFVFKLSKAIGKPCDWPLMKYADECKQQISKQLDVRLLLKRIIFIEHCLTYLVEDYQFDMLQMNKPQSPQQIRRIRKKCQSVLGRSDSSSENTSNRELQLTPVSDLVEPKVTGIELYQSSPALFIKRSSQQNNGLIVKSRFQNKSNKVANQYAGQIMIVDIESRASERSRSNAFQSKRNSNILPISKLPRFQRERRSSFLLDLQRSAQQGNPVSIKIWNELDQDFKRQLENGEFLDIQ